MPRSTQETKSKKLLPGCESDSCATGASTEMRAGHRELPPAEGKSGSKREAPSSALHRHSRRLDAKRDRWRSTVRPSPTSQANTAELSNLLCYTRVARSCSLSRAPTALVLVSVHPPTQELKKKKSLPERPGGFTSVFFRALSDGLADGAPSPIGELAALSSRELALLSSSSGVCTEASSLALGGVDTSDPNLTRLDAFVRPAATGARPLLMGLIEFLLGLLEESCLRLLSRLSSAT